MMGHPQELPSSGLPTPDMVFGNISHMVGVGERGRVHLTTRHIFPAWAGQLGSQNLGFAHLRESQTTTQV